MYTIAIYHNKGGVGKSTLTVFLADFLASLAVRARPMKVVVIDLDPQGSCATSLLGQAAATRIRHAGQTLGQLASALDRGRPVTIDPFVHLRAAPPSRGRLRPMAEVGVMLSDKTGAFSFDANPLHRLTTLRDRLTPLLATRFDIALLDLPGGIDARHLLAVNGLIMSDAVITPMELSGFAIDAMPDTLEMIRHAREHGDGQHPAFLGMILNRVDKRGQQYARNLSRIQDMADALRIPIFEQTLPNARALAATTDEGLPTTSLRERYGDYHPHLQAVTVELFRRWHTLESTSGPFAPDHATG